MIQRLPGIIFHLSIYLSSILGNSKARQRINNRNIQIQNEKFDFWVHASSLGEYWMVEKLIRDLEKRKKKVFVSIFSPSAWDIVSKKEKHFGYVPIDRLSRVNTFLDIINPKFAVFAKYDLWPVMSENLVKRNIPYVITFAQFKRNHHVLWKWNYIENKVFKKAIGIGHQTQESLLLFGESGFSNGFFSGDGRFDYVNLQQINWKPIARVDHFKDGKKLLIAGSSWKKEESLIIPLIDDFPEIKFAFAPHNIERLDELIKSLPNHFILISKLDSYTQEKISKAKILVVDTMGQLQQLYGHSDIAIIGGGFHHGLHNILEALVFQNIVTFGPKTNNHWEAIKCGADILNLNVDSKELKKWISELLDLDEDIVKQKKKSAQDFIKNNLGATDRVIKFIDEYFN